MSIRPIYFVTIIFFPILVSCSQSAPPSCDKSEFDCLYRWVIYEGDMAPPSYKRIPALVATDGGIDRLRIRFSDTGFSKSKRNTMIMILKEYRYKLGSNKTCMERGYVESFNYLNSVSRQHYLAPYAAEELLEISCK